MSLLSWLPKRKRPDRAARRRTPTSPRKRSTFRPQLEALEDRWLPSTLTVLNNLDSGPGSLRADIAAANSGDTIVFATSLDGKTITLTSGQLTISKNLTIQGPGANQLTISGDQLSRVFEVNANQPVVLSGLTISNGHSAIGGAIFNHSTLTISGCTVSNSRTFIVGSGGGIFNSGTLTVSNCTVSGDFANIGGGIYNSGTMTVSNSTVFGNKSSYNGAGIYNRGTLTVSGSTLSGNGAQSGDGGGIENYSGTATLTNSTLCNNKARYGGGALCVELGKATLTNCTLSLNSANYGGGIDMFYQGGHLNLTNTIVAGNYILSGGPDIYNPWGGAIFADHNLIGDGAGCNDISNGSGGNIVGGINRPPIYARLGPLQNNGGPTQTMALLAGSPAIGHADNSRAPAADQRGVTRIDEAGETTDIGAFEV